MDRSPLRYFSPVLLIVLFLFLSKGLAAEDVESLEDEALKLKSH